MGSVRNPRSRVGSHLAQPGAFGPTRVLGLVRTRAPLEEQRQHLAHRRRQPAALARLRLVDSALRRQRQLLDSRQRERLGRQVCSGLRFFLPEVFCAFTDTSRPAAPLDLICHADGCGTVAVQLPQVLEAVVQRPLASQQRRQQWEGSALAQLLVQRLNRVPSAVRPPGPLARPRQVHLASLRVALLVAVHLGRV